MEHTVDTLMVLAYKIRDARTYEWDVSEAVEAGNTLRTALTEALAQPVREPLTDEQIWFWWSSENGLEDCNMCNCQDFIKVVRAVEKAHHIGGDK